MTSKQILIWILFLVLASPLAGAESVRSLPEVIHTCDQKLPPVRAITHGPKFHWFSYYDKLQFDPTGRYVLGTEVGFEHRSPEANDVIKIGMIDLQDGDKWIELGQSSAWGWQQGCMLQWLPGSKSEIIWNGREGEKFVCHILDVFTRKKRTLDFAIYSIAPDGRTGVTTDFRRIQDMRPGYGYAGLADPYKNDLAPEESGIWKVDLQTGEKKLIISIRQISQIPWREDISSGKHYFNHLLFGPDGKRFIFLNRWRMPQARKWVTRMLTATPEGKDIRVIDDNGSTSHFIWRDNKHILAYSWQPEHRWGFYLFEDKTGKREIIGKGIMDRDGHCSYLPGNEWILNDTYPDQQRKIHPYLYHVETGRIVPLGHFLLPPKYKGEWRIDSHPRFSPDGRSVIIDSAHKGNGRQMYLIDISGITGQGAEKVLAESAVCPDAEETPFALSASEGRFEVWGRGRSENRFFFLNFCRHFLRGR